VSALDAAIHRDIVGVMARREQFVVDLLYGDQDGGQRTVSRFVVTPAQPAKCVTHP